MTISGINEYSKPTTATFKATVTLNNGTVHTSDSHPSYFDWRDQNNDFEQYDDYGKFKLPGQGKSGYIWCSYYNGTVSKSARHYVKFVELTHTAEFVSAVAYREKRENGYDYYFVRLQYKRKYSDGTVENVTKDLRDEYFNESNMDFHVIIDTIYPDNPSWQGGDFVVPAGSTMRFTYYLNGTYYAGPLQIIYL